MTRSTHHSTLDSDQDQAATASLIAVLSRLAPSAEPAAVFSNLADLCVPAFCDACTVDLLEDDHEACRISSPPATDLNLARKVTDLSHRGRSSTSTPFQCEPHDTGRRYRGLVVHIWQTQNRPAADAVVARLLVDRAVAAITVQRFADAARQAEDQATNLRTALLNSRQIGAAIGIIMAAHKVTESTAFDMLRTVSQHDHRKLREVATDVLQTGWLEQSQSDANRAPVRHAVPGQPSDWPAQDARKGDRSRYSGR